MNAKVQTIFTPEGDAKKWKMLAGRVPEFLAAYPVKDGWRLERQVLEAGALTPALVDLHKAAITAGKAPSELGLPPLPRGLVFVAKLLDAEGREVASGSATSQAESLFLPAASGRFKDYEAGESAALQRLLAVLGFGGEIFDEDEALTIRSTRARLAPVIPDDLPADPERRPVSSGASREKAKAVVALKREPTPDPASTDAGDELPAPETAEQALAGIGLPVDPPPVRVVEDPAATTEAPTPARAAPKASVSDVTVTPKGRSAGNAQVLAGMNRNIKVMADQAGVAFTPATTIEEAKAAQAKLLASLRK